MESFLKVNESLSAHINNFTIYHLLFENISSRASQSYVKSVKIFPKNDDLFDLSFILKYILFFTRPCFSLSIRSNAVRLMILFLPLIVNSSKRSGIEDLTNMFNLFLNGINVIMRLEEKDKAGDSLNFIKEMKLKLDKESDKATNDDVPLSLLAWEGNDDEFDEYINLMFYFLSLLISFTESILCDTEKLLYVGKEKMDKLEYEYLYKDKPKRGTSIELSKLYNQKLMTVEVIVFFLLGNKITLKIPKSNVIKIRENNVVSEKYLEYFNDDYESKTKLFNKVYFKNKIK
jgi:hypothetical protein